MVPLLVYSNLEFFSSSNGVPPSPPPMSKTFLVEIFQIKVLVSIEVFIQIE